MRVLHIMASGARGGGLTHLGLLLPALRRRGWRVEAAVGSDGPGRSILAEAGIPTYALELMLGSVGPLRPLLLALGISPNGRDYIEFCVGAGLLRGFGAGVERRDSGAGR